MSNDKPIARKNVFRKIITPQDVLHAGGWASVDEKIQEKQTPMVSEEIDIEKVEAALFELATGKAAEVEIYEEFSESDKDGKVHKTTKKIKYLAPSESAAMALIAMNRDRNNGGAITANCYKIEEVRQVLPSSEKDE